MAPFFGQKLEKKPASIQDHSLIKIDLLPNNQKILAPIQRNIFSPQTFSSPISLYSTGRPDLAKGVEVVGEKGEPEEEKIANQASSYLSLRYIGYIHSPEKTIALIIVNGLAMAVEEGEYILLDFKVAKINPEEIILVGPDKGEIRFSLEGEKK
ncbi:MAG: hypothetical protein N3B16_05390 [Candidatus Aminicenantes bacterium]|nr:hypothetical protein [Candidatus Aminicenantes bacterium]